MEHGFCPAPIRLPAPKFATEPKLLLLLLVEQLRLGIPFQKLRLLLVGCEFLIRR